MTNASRKKATHLLRGHRFTAFSINFLILSIEISLIVAEQLWLYRYGILLAVSIIILLDFLFLSPLKAGAVQFYHTLLKNPSNAKFHLLFRFFKYGYRKSLAWRLGCWWRRFVLYLLFSVPCIALTIFTHTLLNNKNAMVALISFIFTIFFFLFALFATEICMFRYAPSAFLLPYAANAKTAFIVSRLSMHGQISNFLLFHLEYSGWFLLSFLLFPLLYIVPIFQTSRAERISDILSQVSPEDLKLLAKRGKI